MITAKNIHKFYGDLEVLKGINLHIEKGEIVSIIGASGAGKTTLLQILGTLDKMSPKTDSSLNINNVKTETLSETELAKFRNNHIGFIFQFHQLLPEFTAVENVCIPALIKNTGKAEAEKRAKELLDFLGLSSRYDHKPSELSGGEQQRVAVARALHHQPEIIIADEPTSALDTETRDEFIELLLQQAKTNNSAVIFVSHDKSLACYFDQTIDLQKLNAIESHHHAV